jgi:hypothetical protein
VGSPKDLHQFSVFAGDDAHSMRCVRPEVIELAFLQELQRIFALRQTNKDCNRFRRSAAYVNRGRSNPGEENE